MGVLHIKYINDLDLTPTSGHHVQFWCTMTKLTKVERSVLRKTLLKIFEKNLVKDFLLNHCFINLVLRVLDN